MAIIVQSQGICLVYGAATIWYDRRISNSNNPKPLYRAITLALKEPVCHAEIGGPAGHHHIGLKRKRSNLKEKSKRRFVESKTEMLMLPAYSHFKETASQ